MFAGTAVGAGGGQPVGDGPPGRRPGPRRGRRPLRPPRRRRAWSGRWSSGWPWWSPCPVHLRGVAGRAWSLVAVTVLVINGVNLIDGLDMLAGGVVRRGRRRLRPHPPRFRAAAGRGPGRRPGRLPRLQPAPGPGLPGRRGLLPAGHGPGRAPGRRRGPPDVPLAVGMAALAAGGGARRRGGLRRRPPAPRPPLADGRRPRPPLRSAGGPGLAPAVGQPGLHRRRGGAGRRRRWWPSTWARLAAAVAVDVARRPSLLVALAVATGALTPDQESRA